MPIHCASVLRPASRLVSLRSGERCRYFSSSPLHWHKAHPPSSNKKDGDPQTHPPPLLTGIRSIIQRLFDHSQPLPRFSAHNKPPLHLPIASAEQNSIASTPDSTRLLYWYCPDLLFAESDFKRIGPPQVALKATRARNPQNVTRWMGYFLEFTTVEDAAVYFTHTQGRELCGVPLRLRFTPLNTPGFTSPLLTKANIPRKAHALVLGLPPATSEHVLLRQLWDFDLLDDDKLAVERLPMGEVKFGGNPMLLRFKTVSECARFVRTFHRETLANSETPVICEVVD